MRNVPAVLFSFFLAACSGTVLLPVTNEMARTGAASSGSLVQLERGRTLYASRCIECHTLPAINAHTVSEWPHLVRWMAKRASLEQDQTDAVIAYILAVRRQNAQRELQ
jgi:mono/diheme cytochrome c family protein